MTVNLFILLFMYLSVIFALRNDIADELKSMISAGVTRDVTSVSFHTSLYTFLAYMLWPVFVGYIIIFFIIKIIKR